MSMLWTRFDPLDGYPFVLAHWKNVLSSNESETMREIHSHDPGRLDELPGLRRSLCFYSCGLYHGIAVAGVKDHDVKKDDDDYDDSQRLVAIVPSSVDDKRFVFVFSFQCFVSAATPLESIPSLPDQTRIVRACLVSERESVGKD
jgi:hypothetical protein